jgi:hypothetical protein
MNGIGDDIGPPRRQRGRAVTLMHVAIDDRDPAYDALFDQPYGGDRQIVGRLCT